MFEPKKKSFYASVKCCLTFRSICKINKGHNWTSTDYLKTQQCFQLNSRNTEVEYDKIDCCSYKIFLLIVIKQDQVKIIFYEIVVRNSREIKSLFIKVRFGR